MFEQEQHILLFFSVEIVSDSIFDLSYGTHNIALICRAETHQAYQRQLWYLTSLRKTVREWLSLINNKNISHEPATASFSRLTCIRTLSRVFHARLDTRAYWIYFPITALTRWESKYRRLEQSDSRSVIDFSQPLHKRAQSRIRARHEPAKISLSFSMFPFLLDHAEIDEIVRSRLEASPVETRLQSCTFDRVALY